MKVLIAHNRYRSSFPSGENTVVDSEMRLLMAAGVEVVPMLESSDEISSKGMAGKVGVGMGPLYSPTGVKRFRGLLAAERPDVVHVHNVFPLISPYVVSAARQMGIPVVQTVHNYRHSCVQGLHLRDDRTCTDCLGRTLPVPAVIHGCYRDSRLQSVPMALSQVVHRRTWRGVDRFIALTPFMASMLELARIPPERVALRPSWVEDAEPSATTGNHVVFIGRLDEAKGVPLLLNAWNNATSPVDRDLYVIGDGPLASAVQAAANQDSSIRFLGPQTRDGVIAAIDSAAFVVLPSIWMEGYPLVMAEAFSRGRPVLAAAGGSAASVITGATGWSFQPTVSALSEALTQITLQRASTKFASSRRYYEEHNSPSAALQSLLNIYTSVISTER